MLRLGFYKTHPSITIPRFATKGAACFDLSYNPTGKYEYQGYNSQNKEFKRPLPADGKLYINPGDRILVPTGLIFDIPEGHSVRIHARSGTSLKKGLVLINAEGVIDHDYVEEVFLLLHNASDNGHSITVGDRIAQAELVKKEEYVLWETYNRPIMKSDRVGGMGSTGISADTTLTYTTEGSITVTPPTQEQPVKRGRGRPRKVTNAA